MIHRGIAMFRLGRPGITKIEVLVILFILAVLIALVLPALNVSRNGPRRNLCMNNIKNLGLAAMNFQTTQGGRLPLLDDGRFGWPVELLPYLDQPQLVREIQSDMFRPDEAPWLKVFTCPEDDDSVDVPGGLSYGGNAGFGLFPVDPKTGVATEKGVHNLQQDWNSNGEISDEERRMTQATGVFWREDDVVSRLTIEEIGAADGAGTTLLVIENLRAGPWTSRDVRDIGIVIDRNRLKFAGTASLDVREARLGPFAIDGADSDRPFPGPSSPHEGMINAVFVDGRASTLSKSIHPTVYLRLMTSQGTLYGEDAVMEQDF